MIISREIDFDLKVEFDLSDTGNKEAEGIERLPYTYTFYENLNYRDESKAEAEWKPVYSNRFTDNSPILQIPRIIKNFDKIKDADDEIWLWSRFDDGDSWNIRKSSRLGSFTFDITTHKQGVKLELYERAWKNLVSAVKEVRKTLGVGKKENEERKKLIFKIGDDMRFVFDPANTYVHGFENNPPKNWESVYKVYYAFKIQEKYPFSDNVKWEDVLVTTFDECSVIPYLPENLKKFDEVSQNNILKARPFCDGIDWMIEKLGEMYDKKIWYIVNLFDDHKGCRFYLRGEEFDRFIEYLEFINDYAMRNCGYPI